MLRAPSLGLVDGRTLPCGTFERRVAVLAVEAGGWLALASRTRAPPGLVIACTEGAAGWAAAAPLCVSVLLTPETDRLQPGPLRFGLASLLGGLLTPGFPLHDFHLGLFRLGDGGLRHLRGRLRLCLTVAMWGNLGLFLDSLYRATAHLDAGLRGRGCPQRPVPHPDRRHNNVEFHLVFDTYCVVEFLHPLVDFVFLARQFPDLFNKLPPFQLQFPHPLLTHGGLGYPSAELPPGWRPLPPLARLVVVVRKRIGYRGPVLHRERANDLFR